MSRSYKKQLVVKDTSTKRGERNRMVRRVNKILVTIGKEPKLADEIINQYDVCDWKVIHNLDSKYLRK